MNTTLSELYSTYTEDRPKEVLRYNEFSSVNNIEENDISIIVKSEGRPIYNHVFKTNTKKYKPEQMAEDIYKNLENDMARRYHIITVFITINKEIHPFKFITSVDKPDDKIDNAVKKAMFVSKPKQNEKKIAENKNFVDFKITKGRNIICRRFIYIPDTVTDLSDAYEMINKGLSINESGKYNHRIKISFRVSNDLTGVDFFQEFSKIFNSDNRLINVKDNVIKMTNSFFNEIN